MKTFTKRLSMFMMAGALAVSLSGCGHNANNSGGTATAQAQSPAGAQGSYLEKGVPTYEGNMQIYFSRGPKDHANAEQAIVSAIRKAKRSINVQAYSFTNPTIIRALAETPKSVKVHIILDKSNKTSRDFAKYRPILEEHGFVFSGTGERPGNNVDRYVMVDYVPAIAHNKIMIIDDTLVITGSYNFTYSAEKRNAENCLLIQSPDVAKVYQENFNVRYGQSKWFGAQEEGQHRK